jgi:hypothetical protein
VRIFAKFEVGGTVEKFMDQCRNCSGKLPAAAAGSRGRPRTFCSVACRRAAEFEIRRINARLGSLEDRLSESRLPNTLGFLTMDDPKLLLKEIALQRRRLLDLLSEEETAPAS